MNIFKLMGSLFIHDQIYEHKNNLVLALIALAVCPHRIIPLN